MFINNRIYREHRKLNNLNENIQWRTVKFIHSFMYSIGLNFCIHTYIYDCSIVWTYELHNGWDSYIWVYSVVIHIYIILQTPNDHGNYIHSKHKYMYIIYIWMCYANENVKRKEVVGVMITIKKGIELDNWCICMQLKCCSLSILLAALFI